MIYLHYKKRRWILFFKIKINGITLKKLDKAILLIQKANMIVNKVVLYKDDMRFSGAEYISAILKSLNIKIITVSDSKVKIRME